MQVLRVLPASGPPGAALPQLGQGVQLVNGVQESWVIIIGIVAAAVVLVNWADAFRARGVAKWQSKGKQDDRL